MAFDPDEARRAALMAEASYRPYWEPWEHTEAHVKSMGYPTSQFINIGSCQCIVATNLDSTVVSFAGSQNIPDWIANLKAKLVGLMSDDDPRKVHRGFRASVALAHDKIADAVREFHVPHRKRLVLTGHSKGAAETTLFAFSLLADIEFTPDVVYPIASPRVGNRRFAREYDYQLGGKTWRIVNNNDAVTRMPPRFSRYRHVGRLVYLDWRGRLHEEPGLLYRFANQLAGRAWAWWHDKNYFDGATDHMLEHYLPLMEAVA